MQYNVVDLTKDASMQSCYLETYAMVARSLLKKQSATKKVTSRTCTIYVCLRFKLKKKSLNDSTDMDYIPEQI